MSVTVCVACGHPASEHTAMGCRDLLDLGDDGYPLLCACRRSEPEVYRQHVPPVGEIATGARGGEGDS